MEKSPKQKTIHLPKQIPEDRATLLFNFLYTNTEWGEGIKSRKGFTRKASSLDSDEFCELFLGSGFEDVLIQILQLVNMHSHRQVLHGIYLNLYENGDMWTPNHSHAKSSQMVISLGETRILEMGKKKYSMEHGDIILFGSGQHGVPKDDSKKPRISIALFLGE